ncbi:MAG: sulfatase [Bryobacterales bacterium]|nr:sulfatase [Bryobacterales bacterium]
MALSRRSFLPALAAPYLALGQRRDRPHVLFIGADDLNNSLGCYGHPIVKSPNIDRIASMGVRFDRAYCQFPLCGPSRTSLLSGLRPDSTQILANNISVRDKVPNALTLPQHFKNNGWDSNRFGKMYHMDVPGSVGTNKWDDPPSWNTAISPPGKEQHTEGTRYPIETNGKAQWVSISFSNDGKDQADDRCADLTIEAFSQTKDPLFVGLGFVRPHVPNVAPSRFYDLYPLANIPAPVNPPDDRGDIPKASELCINTRANDIGMNDAGKREAIRSYYASISYMDWQVGRVLSALEKQKLLDKTIIVFWGDHGYHLGEHHRWHKRSLFEESARAPLIIAAPGRRGKGKGSKALVEFVDMYPTIAELGGLPVPQHCEGQSAVPLLDNPARPWKSGAFTQMHGPDNIVGRSVRTDRYRYTRWTGPYPDEELYDHQADPKEFTNLARQADKYKDVLVRMRGTLDAGWKAAKAKV